MLKKLIQKKKERDLKCFIFDNALKHGKAQQNYRAMIRKGR